MECIYYVKLILKTALTEVEKQAASPKTMTTRMICPPHAQGNPHELAKTILLHLKSGSWTGILGSAA